MTLFISIMFSAKDFLMNVYAINGVTYSNYTLPKVWDIIPSTLFSLSILLSLYYYLLQRHSSNVYADETQERHRYKH